MFISVWCTGDEAKLFNIRRNEIEICSLIDNLWLLFSIRSIIKFDLLFEGKAKLSSTAKKYIFESIESMETNDKFTKQSFLEEKNEEERIIKKKRVENQYIFL